MSLYNNKYRIESARLKGWDYKLEGSYFIAICTQDRDNLFGYVKNGNMVLNQFGAIVNRCWFDLPNHYQNIRLDAFVVMPNHVHGIMDYSNLFVPSKNFSARRINELRQSPGKPIWQPRFHDHIIRDNAEYYRIRQYIINNPKHLLEN